MTEDDTDAKALDTVWVRYTQRGLESHMMSQGEEGLMRSTIPRSARVFHGLANHRRRRLPD